MLLLLLLEMLFLNNERNGLDSCYVLDALILNCHFQLRGFEVNMLGGVGIFYTCTELNRSIIWPRGGEVESCILEMEDGDYFQNLKS